MTVPGEKKPDDVWKFTKQETRFDQVLKSVDVFKSAKGGKKNIEDYFMKFHEEFDLETNRHRILTTAQLYGLLTKQYYYERRGKYEDEDVTPAYDEIKKSLGDLERYNALVTEQILKVKIKAIVDTTDNCSDWNIYPVIASYVVLKKLRDRGMSEVGLDEFISYAMRCASYQEVDWAVECISSGQPPVDNVDHLADLSRIKKVLDNLNLFRIDDKERTISLNPSFIDYFEDNFMNDGAMRKLFDDALMSDSRYGDFLCNIQGLGINLIDYPGNDGEVKLSDSEEKRIMREVQSKVPDSPTRDNVSNLLKLLDNEYADEPASIKRRVCTAISRNKQYAEAVKLRAGYKCEICGVMGFEKAGGGLYAEAHHVGELAKTRIDNPNVMICVCPTCHRVIHYGTQEELAKRRQ